MNQLALRSRIQGNPRFAELLEAVRATTLAAYDHQDLPFERLVDAVVAERNLGQQPIFQVKIVLQNPPTEALAVSGLTFRAVPRAHTVARFDLILFLSEQASALDCHLEYATDLFDRSTADALLRRLSIALSTLAADPGRRVFDVPLFSAAERAMILAESAGPSVPRPERRTVQDAISVTRS